MNPFFQMLPGGAACPCRSRSARSRRSSHRRRSSRARTRSCPRPSGSISCRTLKVQLSRSRHKGADLHRRGQYGAVSRLRGGSALLPDERAHGGGLRSRHHRDDAYDDAPSRGVSLEHPEKAGARGRHRARVRRDRGGVLPLVAEQIRPRRVCRGAHGARALSHHGRMAARHAARAGVRHTPAGRRLSPESRYAP